MKSATAALAVAASFAFFAFVAVAVAYDPDDPEIVRLVPAAAGRFEAFYAREAHGVAAGAARPPHGHGSFYKHRNPALVDARNPGAYGYRFDGARRRFNFDRDEEDGEQ